MHDEAAKRLDFAAFDPALEAAATDFLRATGDLSREAVGKSDLLAVALARHAGEGWPRTPSLHFALASLPGARKLADRARPRGVSLSAFGAASHARVFASLGFDLAMRTPADAPFSLRQDPELSAAHQIALLMAAVTIEPAFHARVLRCGARVAAAQSRALAAAALIAARADAARILRAEEATEIFWGRPFFLRPRLDAAGRFRAWLALPALLAEVVSRHDEDWFRNPRFWDELAIRIATPAEPLKNRPSLAAAFEARLA